MRMVGRRSSGRRLGRRAIIHWHDRYQEIAVVKVLRIDLTGDQRNVPLRTLVRLCQERRPDIDQERHASSDPAP